jgi:hypothetical protein
LPCIGFIALLHREARAEYPKLQSQPLTSKATRLNTGAGLTIRRQNPAATAVRLAAVAAAVALIALGALVIYRYTSPPTSASSASSSTPEISSSSSQVEIAPPSGYQDSSGQPQGMWSDYLGFIPRGYVLAPRQDNGPIFPCPSGMDSVQCQQFQASCGNGVCDPNESCTDCPIDCGPEGQLTCDPFTLRPGSPIGPCQVGAVFPGDTGGGGN